MKNDNPDAAEQPVQNIFTNDQLEILTIRVENLEKGLKGLSNFIKSLVSKLSTAAQTAKTETHVAISPHA